MGVKHLKKRQSTLHDGNEFLLPQFRKVIKLWDPGACSDGKFLNLRSSEIVGNVYFSDLELILLEQSLD